MGGSAIWEGRTAARRSGGVWACLPGARARRCSDSSGGTSRGWGRVAGLATWLRPHGRRRNERTTHGATLAPGPAVIRDQPIEPARQLADCDGCGAEEWADDLREVRRGVDWLHLCPACLIDVDEEITWPCAVCDRLAVEEREHADGCPRRHPRMACASCVRRTDPGLLDDAGRCPGCSQIAHRPGSRCWRCLRRAPAHHPGCPDRGRS